VFAHARQIKRAAARRGYGDVRLFGSVARGEETEGSDVDLLVRGQASLVQLAGLADDLTAMLQVPVDIAPEHALKESILAAAQAEAIPL
jgi:predicted nucleotidyltransferase